MYQLVAALMMAGWVFSQARLKLAGLKLASLTALAFFATLIVSAVALNLGTLLLGSGLVAYLVNIGSMALAMLLLIKVFQSRIRKGKGNTSWLTEGSSNRQAPNAE